MRVEIRLPELGESMTSAKISSWLKREGESVVAGQPLVEVETDKTTVEIEAPRSGVLQTICVPAGTDSVAVGTVLGVVAEGAMTVTERPREVRAPEAASASPQVAPGSDPPREATFKRTKPEGNEEIAVSPLAARMADLAGIDLATLSARLGGARVARSDVETWLENETSRRASAPLEMPAEDQAGPRAFDEVRLTPMRRLTASRLQQAKRDIPHFYLQADCNVTELVRLRSRLATGEGVQKPTITDVLIVACALALKDVPLANATWVDDVVRVHHAVDMSVAVNTSRGLVTPVVRNCQDKTLELISREVKGLIDRARAGRLSREEYTGGTCTISNLGMFGISAATPILNPPQCCIIGVGAIERRPVAVGDGLAVGDMMTCTLAADHRAIDGAIGAEFLQAIRRRLEDPASIIRLHDQ